MDRMLNPDVFVRGKGVMEKCTFCVQRIRKAKDTAKDEGRKVQDGEVTPACAQTCPTDAIVFGNMLDKESRVYKKSESDREFRVLEMLGTLPAVHYLRKGEDIHES
jgi:molybdopterin-containing oxidoreductase family iron-sulfur binding subunit